MISLFKGNTSKKPIGCRYFLGLLLLVTSLTTIYANPSSFVPITLQEAVRLSLLQHPDLASFKYEKKSMDAYVTQAGVGAIPELGIELENALGTGEQSSFDNAQTTMSISWVLDDEVVSRKIKLAQSKSVNVDLEQEIKKLDVAAETARLFITTLILEQKHKLALEGVSQAKDIIQLVQHRVKSGKSAELDLLLAKDTLIDRELAAEDLTHELKVSRYLLFSQWNAEQVGTITGNLTTLPIIPGYEEVASKVRNNPQFKLFANKSRIAQSQILTKKEEAKPLWQVTAGVRRYEATDDYGVVAGISIPFGGEDRNRGIIRALNEKVNTIEVESQALEKEIIRQLFKLYQELNHSMHVIETLSEQNITMLEQAFSQAKEAYQVGRMSYNEWQSVQTILNEKKEGLLDAYLMLNLNYIEVERLTGGLL